MTVPESPESEKRMSVNLDEVRRRADAGRAFDEVFADHRLTPAERRELVYRLAAIRAQKTIEALLK